MKKYLRSYIYTNIKEIFTILFCLIFGLVIGIILFNISDLNLKNEIFKMVTTTFDIAKNNNFEGINIIANSLKQNLCVIAIVYFFALTLVPKLLINIFSILKGISIGLYIPVLFSIFGISNGVISLILLIILPNVIYFITYIYLCNNSLMFHKTIIEEGFKVSACFLEVAKIIVIFSLMLASVIVEQIGSTVIINSFIL